MALTGLQNRSTVVDQVECLLDTCRHTCRLDDDLGPSLRFLPRSEDGRRSDLQPQCTPEGRRLDRNDVRSKKRTHEHVAQSDRPQSDNEDIRTWRARDTPQSRTGTPSGSPLICTPIAASRRLESLAAPRQEPTRTLHANLDLGRSIENLRGSEARRPRRTCRRLRSHRPPRGQLDPPPGTTMSPGQGSGHTPRDRRWYRDHASTHSSQTRITRKPKPARARPLASGPVC